MHTWQACISDIWGLNEAGPSDRYHRIVITNAAAESPG